MHKRTATKSAFGLAECCASCFACAVGPWGNLSAGIQGPVRISSSHRTVTCLFMSGILMQSSVSTCNLPSSSLNSFDKPPPRSAPGSASHFEPLAQFAPGHVVTGSCGRLNGAGLAAAPGPPIPGPQAVVRPSHLWRLWPPGDAPVACPPAPPPPPLSPAAVSTASSHAATPCSIDAAPKTISLQSRSCSR